MLKAALSTVACPENTLDEAVALAARLDYDGLEMRTFGHGSTDLTCEPLLTGPARARDLFEDHGVAPVCLATSISFDKPVFPPVIGRILQDVDAPVRHTKQMVEAAVALGCPFIRVFGFEIQPGESRKAAMPRIMERLRLALATARHTGARLLLENGGSFPTSSDVLELVERAASPLLAVAYSPAAAVAGGEDPVQGARALGDLLEVVKLKDFAGGDPVVLGDGEIPNEHVIRDLSARGFDGWAVVEWDRLWLPGLDESDAPLVTARQRLAEWARPPVSDRERRKFLQQA